MNPSREVIDRSERQPHTDFSTTHYIDAPARSHTSISSLADDQQLTCSHVTKPSASPPTSLGCPRTSGEPRSRNDLRTYSRIAPLPILVQHLLVKHRGIRYTIRARIVRGEWTVAIHPRGIEGAGKVFNGPRERAEQLARSMIDKWLSERRAQAR
jgi:hypothetical protein